MATLTLLDTHIVLWLYDDPDGRLPQMVRDRLENDDLAISPIVRLEIQFLFEIGRIAASGQHILDDLVPRLEITLTNPPAGPLCAAAAELTWTRDPFDRLIAGESAAQGMPLITKDKTIRKHLRSAWWGDAEPSIS